MNSPPGENLWSFKVRAALSFVTPPSLKVGWQTGTWPMSLKRSLLEAFRKLVLSVERTWFLQLHWLHPILDAAMLLELLQLDLARRQCQLSGRCSWTDRKNQGPPSCYWALETTLSQPICILNIKLRLNRYSTVFKTLDFAPVTCSQEYSKLKQNRCLSEVFPLQNCLLKKKKPLKIGEGASLLEYKKDGKNFNTGRNNWR